jgi:hypothetical protein
VYIFNEKQEKMIHIACRDISVLQPAQLMPTNLQHRRCTWKLFHTTLRTSKSVTRNEKLVYMNLPSCDGKLLTFLVNYHEVSRNDPHNTPAREHTGLGGCNSRDTHAVLDTGATYHKYRISLEPLSFCNTFFTEENKHL